MKASRQQAGFTTVEIIVAALVVIILGFAIYAFAGQKDKANKSANTSTTNKQNDIDNQSSDTESEGSEAEKVRKATEAVRTTFDRTQAYVAKTSNADQGQIDAVREQLSEGNYFRMINDYQNGFVTGDPFTCAQTAVPGYTTSPSEVRNGAVVITVTEAFATPVYVDYEVDLSTMHIIDIRCQ